MSNEYREWAKSKGICVNCFSEKAWNGRTMCPECLDKHKERCEKTRSDKSKEQRKKYLKRKRDLCIAFGICRECLKRETKVRLKCLECYVKEVKRNSRNRNRNNVPRKRRVGLGLCYFCEAPSLENKKVCSKCYEFLLNNLKKVKKSNANHYWRKYDAAGVKRTTWNKNKHKL